MANVEFEDNFIEVMSAIGGKIEAVLEECAGELESQVKRNTRVDTGDLKNSWQHHVSGSASGEYIAYIGSASENAIWEEFGTGEYALKGNGRKSRWTYRTEKGDYFSTTGKKPSRAFWNAFNSKKAKIMTRIENALKGLQ